MSLWTLLMFLLVASEPPSWRAPADATHVVPRLSHRTRGTFANLLYEGNNKALRGPNPTSACSDAQRTRALAVRTAGLFLLRDALFSQQDHPIERPACALMVPTNWISGAVDDALHGRVTAPVVAPALDDDGAWAALSSAEAMFAGFQASTTLHEWAIRDRAGATASERENIDNARGALHTLAAAAAVLIDASGKGPRAVAEAGAELVAASDRAYFGEGIRRDHVIPLFVENPSEHEIVDENKGLQIHGRPLDEAAIALTRELVYRRRLQDGPLAIERYDITRPQDVAHLLEVLAMLVPKGEAGHPVYVWVGGPLVAGTERVEDVHDGMPKLMAALAAADLAHDRIKVFARPVFQTKGHERADLESAIDRARSQGVLYGANMTGDALRSWMRW